jgi:hypothetical protein
VSRDPDGEKIYRYIPQAAPKGGGPMPLLRPWELELERDEWRVVDPFEAIE